MQIGSISFPFRQLQTANEKLSKRKSIDWLLFLCAPAARALMMSTREEKVLDLTYCSQFAFIVRSFRQTKQ